MQVVNLLGAKLLQGTQATLHGLLNILREPFEIIWFATHGNENGIYLSDGVLNTSEITTMVRSAGAKLTVLNTCSSRPVALTIHDELGMDFVCTVRPVPDRTAFITGSIFAQKIADGLDFYSAYEAAKPGQNSTYTYLGAKDIYMPPTGGIRYGAQGLPGQMPDAETLARIVRTVEDISIVVFGMPNADLPPLRDVLREVRGQLSSVQEGLRGVNVRLDKIEERQRLRNLWMGAMFVIILFLLATVAVMARFIY